MGSATTFEATEALQIRKMVQITIRGQNSHFLECTGAENVAELKAKIAVLENLPVSELRLFSAGTPLVDESCFSTLTSSIIDVTQSTWGCVCVCVRARAFSSL